MADTRLPPPKPIDPGAAGRSGAPGADRRLPPERRRRRDRLGGFVKRRVRRERRLGRLLERELGPVAVVLHDRETAPADPPIDHLVVAASGVWIVEACHAPGRITRHRLGARRGQAWLRTRDGSRLPVVEARPVVDRVLEELAPMGFDWLDVHRVVCFTNARWGLGARPFGHDDALVTWGRALVDRIAVPGALGPRDMKAVAVELSARLPARS